MAIRDEDMKRLVLARIDELMALSVKIDRLETGSNQYFRDSAALFSGSLSLVKLAYGSGSEHVAYLQKTGDKGAWAEHYGILQTLKFDLENGFFENVRLTVAGEVLADLIGMAKEALRDKKLEVAAVLTAAAFEDCVRRLAEHYLGIVTRDPLETLVNALKKGGHLSGTSHRLVINNLGFRNDALHADWKKLDTASVTAVLTFVEQLLAAHFAFP